MSVDVSGKNHGEINPNCRRKDFFGRAILFHIEHLFTPGPAHKEGKRRGAPSIPREVAPGLIVGIKRTATPDSSHHYEMLFRVKAERYRHNDNYEVDLDGFANNGMVRSVAWNIVKRFEESFSKMTEEERRVWLCDTVEGTEEFNKLGRQLTDEEYQILHDCLLGAKK